MFCLAPKKETDETQKKIQSCTSSAVFKMSFDRNRILKLTHSHKTVSPKTCGLNLVLSCTNICLIYRRNKGLQRFYHLQCLHGKAPNRQQSSPKAGERLDGQVKKRPNLNSIYNNNTKVFKR